MTSLRALVVRNAALAAVVPLLLLTIFLLTDQERRSRAELDRSLVIAVSTLGQALAGRPLAELRAEVRRLDPELGLRLTVVREDGVVLADSEADPGRMENHADRPEVRQALAEGIGRADHRSATLHQEMRYLAISFPPAPGAGGERRVFRAAAPQTRIRAEALRTQAALLAAVAAVFLCAVFLFIRLARQIVGPVEALASAAARFAGGERGVHVLPDGPPAVHRLGTAFNEMVDTLDGQVRSLAEARAYLDAVVRQVPEGLLVLDAQGVITRANPAAEALLGTPADRLTGRPLLAVLLNYALDREVRRVLDGGRGAPAEEGAGAVEVRTPDGRSLRVAVGPLVVGEAGGQYLGIQAGAVVVLEDVSELRRIDDMRRDFIANVSHELRTPAAAIQAMVDTLLLRAEKRPELVPEYAGRMAKECERIDHLVRDLLLLAETEAGHLRLAPEALDAREVAEEVVRQVEPVIASTGTQVVLEEFPGERVRADRFALAQCLRNLVDNAVRYAGGSVRLGGRLERNQVVLYVADDGPGIPAEDLPRIFERFYRVDKSRAREGGGSGLGLSIVRHLAEVQGGRAWTESPQGRGSTFYLAFPKADG